MEKAIRESADKASQGYPKVPKFLSILFQILEERKHSEFICWSPDGKIVVINKPVEFAEQLLPVYFKHSNYSSFVRQLNLYNFRKKKHCPQENAFAHAMFLRGRRDLLQYVKRKNSNISPEERSCVQFEMYVNNEGEYDEVVDQNQSLKRVQEEMAQKIQRLEQVVDALTNENESLLHQCRRKKENEHFLKRVVNHIARIHGRPQISELIESIAYETLGNKLTLKSEPDRLVHTKTREAQRYEKATPNFMNNDIFFEARSKDFNEKDYSTLQTPYLQTLASVSTMPEFNDPFDFQHDFDQIIDQKLRQQPPNSFDLEASSRVELDDFLCFGENPSGDVMLGQF